MPQVNSFPPAFKRPMATSRGSSARRSSPIQTLKLPPVRLYTATPLISQPHPLSQPNPLVHPPQKAALDEQMFGYPDQKTAGWVRPWFSRLAELHDRSDPKTDLRQQSGQFLQSQKSQKSQKSRQPTGQQRQTWEWLLIGGVAVAGILGGTGTSAMLWLSSLPPLPQCGSVTWRSLDGQRLFCAQEAANSGKPDDLLKGINLLKDESLDPSLKPEAQRFIARWSREILRLAQEKINRNDLKGAVAIARQVPASSPAYGEVQTAIAQWQAQWQKGEAAIALAQKAIQQKNWAQASQQVRVLGELEPLYWRLQRADELSRQILNSKQAHYAFLKAEKLKAEKLEAQKVAQSGQPQGWEGAIAKQDEDSWNLAGGEAPFAQADSQPVEEKSLAPEISFRTEVEADIFPADAAPEKSFEGYYDERYFENSY
ncbi:MAG: hypothetical protein HC781_20015 [Leptolyngbyaceae cyanobacterium CSU_1_4]|nr:hypothetical protein [Leptolyngbyaceae cyanobacterium CSU_1_4]